jgi:1-phosphofructokinase
MIATVTLNPAIDKSLIVSRFEVGKTNRGEVVRIDAGGKGINVAKALKQFGTPVRALGFVAGNNGRFIREALCTSGIPEDLIDVPGETRINLKVHDPVFGSETELNEPGFKVDSEHLEKLKQKVKEYAARCEVMVFSGSLPPGASPETFAELITVAGGQRAKCILDTVGSALALGLHAKPLLIKPNRAETEALLQEPLNTPGKLAAAARKLLALGASQVVISMGAEGAVAATAQESLLARPLAVTARSSVGAGDAMVAALAYGEVKHLPFRESFRLAIATSAAAVTMEGTKMGDLALIESLLPQVRIEDLR